MPFDLKADFERYVDLYETDWQLFDRTLYDLCVKNLTHANVGQINAKLWLIGRGLATGVERGIKKKAGESTLEKLASHLLQHHKEVDAVVRQLGKVNQPLDLDKLKTIISEDGKFCSLVSRIARKTTIVSFAAKYLHYHVPAVPIFDNLAYGQAWRRRCKVGLELFPLPKGANGHYYAYCLCIWQFYSQLQKLTSRLKVRTAEGYLMSWAYRKDDPAFRFVSDMSN